MIDLSVLAAALGSGRDWVAASPDGGTLEIPIPEGIGPATLLVLPLSDSVKRISQDGLVAGSVERDGLWEVRVIVLNRIVLRDLGHRRMGLRELYDLVGRLGYGWQIQPMGPPPEPSRPGA